MNIHIVLLGRWLHACRFARRIEGLGFASSVEPEKANADEDSARTEKLVAKKIILVQ